MPYYNQSNTAFIPSESNYLDIHDAATDLCRAVQERSTSEVQNIMESRNFPVKAIFFPCESLQQDDGKRRTLTALHYAVESTDSKTLDILTKLLRVLRGYRPNGRGEDISGLEVVGTAQIKRWIQDENGGAFEYSSESYTPLCWACLFANFTAVAKLIEAGVEVNSTASEDGTTALMAVGSRTSPDYKLDHAKEERKIVKFLLEEGATFDIQDGDGNTALHFMIQKASHFDELHQWILLLLKSGQVHVNCNGWNVLHCSAFYVPKSTTIRKILRAVSGKKTVQLDGTTNLGYTAYALAQRAGNRKVAFEIKSNESKQQHSFQASPQPTPRGNDSQNEVSTPDEADRNAQPSLSIPKAFDALQKYPQLQIDNDLSDDENQKATMVLSAAGFQVDSGSFEMARAISWAAENGNRAVVRLLVEKGADVEAKDGNERTALSWAARGGHEAVVRLLVEKGADVEAKDGYGWTALGWAAGGGHEAVVRLLVESGADVEAKNSNGWTALGWAADNGHEAVVRLLRSVR